MPSKKFLEAQKKGLLPGAPGEFDELLSPPDGEIAPPPSDGGMPGGSEFSFSEEYGVPVMPDDYAPEEPVIPAGHIGGAVTVGGIAGLHLTKPGLREKSCFMHIHGGGFTIGSAMGCTGILQHFIDTTRLEGYSVEYRLAPKHKFPASIEDCVAFYSGLLDMGYENIIVGGESAGAGLTLSLTLALKARGIKLPAAIWCSSPIDDIEFTKREIYKEDMLMATSGGIIRAYAGDADLKNPLLSPIYGDFSGFPPMLIQTGGDECLAAGAVRLTAKAAREDVDVIFHFGKDMGHTYALLYGMFPEATNAMREITDFVNNNLDLDAQ